MGNYSRIPPETSLNEKHNSFYSSQNPILRGNLHYELDLIVISVKAVEIKVIYLPCHHSIYEAKGVHSKGSK